MTIFLVMLLLSGLANTCTACDSSMLEILTGSSKQSQLTSMMLAVSQKMQQTGSLLKAFNNAAATSLHHEIMENWLSITSKVAGSEKSESSNLMIRISRDLGQIRRQLASADLEMIHERIEACITRVSLVCAILNNHQVMRRFLEIELDIFQLRPVVNDQKKLRELLVNCDLEKQLSEFEPGVASAAPKMLATISDTFKLFKESIEKPNFEQQTTLRLLQSLVNHYIDFKKYLLNIDFFKQP
ncbi:MAG TPA: hypothetical protein PLM07_02550 [Candidatus Rifleibacterium sp.]|nr:hypothetical protein [Candidatus Rifleibacterium sp.]HPT44763.1 hypothetical protein [Candidatus Rifleibacterium sp.]